jgi:hypothetical protein
MREGQHFSLKIRHQSSKIRDGVAKVRQARYQIMDATSKLNCPKRISE